MENQSCIILLTGFPGSGKLTTAEELAKKHQFKLIANYYVNKPVLELVEKTENSLPSELAWEKIEIIWETVLATIRDLSPQNFSFVITRPLIQGMDYSTNFYTKILKLSEHRKNLLVPVRLECNENELVKRIQSEKRKQLGKVTDSNRAKHLLSNHHVFTSKHPNEITINNTNQAPEETVNIIMSHVRKLGFKRPA